MHDPIGIFTGSFTYFAPFYCRNGDETVVLENVTHTVPHFKVKDREAQSGRSHLSVVTRLKYARYAFTHNIDIVCAINYDPELRRWERVRRADTNTHGARHDGRTWWNGASSSHLHIGRGVRGASKFWSLVFLGTAMADERLRAWVRSIDATYELVENPEVRKTCPDLASKVERALWACESAWHDYGVDGCAFSFNGGKDCTVLAHILAASLRRLQKKQGTFDLVPIRTLYVACDDPFPEVEAFIGYAAARYHMQLRTEHGPMRQALDSYMKSTDGKGVHAMFIGVRHDDPHGSKARVRVPCDPTWPQIMRVHPILEWDYRDIWAFLRCPLLQSRQEHVPACVAGQEAGVPYCVLYDQGYTSLGDRYHTTPNPQLYDTSTNRFQPAYFLQDGSKERCGRLSHSTKPTT